MKRSPFWYVVKTRASYRSPEGLPTSKQSFARVFSSAWRARNWATGQHWAVNARIVKVWASLPKQKLPEWLADRPEPLGDNRVAVWRIGPDKAERYVLRVGAEGCWLTWLDVYRRSGKDDSYAHVSIAPAAVWMEASLRAAALLRAEKQQKTCRDCKGIGCLKCKGPCPFAGFGPNGEP